MSASAPAALDRCVVLHAERSNDISSRSAEARLEEAVRLAEAIDLKVVKTSSIVLARPRPATLIGLGKVEEIKNWLETATPRPGIVIVNAALTPVQHRNLEKEWNAKVLDRTALILEIFGARARTAEGRLQVDLAHLTYQKSRLVRSWTHLERQRGGRGFLGGPGESQIESDRRAISDHIDRLKLKLEDVRRTRSLQRARRQRAPHPVIALVGYTNAGKSTLFNRVTASQVVAQDLLFATLDPTMRAVDLPTGQRVVMSDTVGFISDLPTQLVAAFRATLEEVMEADVIVHVRDAAHDESEAQRDDVIAVLEELGLTEENCPPVIEALNKIDLLDEERRLTKQALARHSQGGAPMTLREPLRACVSAVTGEGVGELLMLIDELTTADRESYEIALEPGDGAARAYLHDRGHVMSEENADGAARLLVRLSEKAIGQFRKQFPAAQIEAPKRGDAARLSA